MRLFGTRYYDANVGRWTKQDPLPGSIGDPSQLNRYVYVGDNPINLVDPTGLYGLLDLPEDVGRVAGYAYSCAEFGLLGAEYGSFYPGIGTTGGAIAGCAAGLGYECPQNA